MTAPLLLRAGRVLGALMYRVAGDRRRIAQRNLLPEAGRFAQLADLEWAFGTMGVQDRARHIATLFLEDLSDLIRATGRFEVQTSTGGAMRVRDRA